MNFLTITGESRSQSWFQSILDSRCPTLVRVQSRPVSTQSPLGDLLPPRTVFLRLAVDAQQTREKSRPPLHRRLDATLRRDKRSRQSTASTLARWRGNAHTFVCRNQLTSMLRCARPPPLRLVGSPAPPRDMVSMETLRPRIAR